MTDEETDLSPSEAAKRAKSGLSRVNDGPHERMQADLARALTDKLMAPTDVGGAVARDFDAQAAIVLPTLADIDHALDTVTASTSGTVNDFERLLSITSLGDLKAEGQRLSDLLDRGGISINERSILRRGLAFMRRGMHSEAAEWWNLNSPDDSSTRFCHLLKLLLALTYRIAGNDPAADAVIAQLRQHSKFDF
jgi:hypothetical protein